MNLIIGNINQEMKTFIRNHNFTTNTLVINKMCNVKYLTDAITLYIPFGIINRFGLVSDTMVHVEELLISLNVKKIYYGDVRNQEILNKLSNMYCVEIELLNNK